MRKPLAALILLGGLLASGSAMAQGICPMGQPSPTLVNGTTSYTLTSYDQCKLLIFGTGAAVTVTAPDASTLQNAGFQVVLMTTGANLTVVSSTSLINRSTAEQSVTGYTPLTLFGDGVNYWATITHGTVPMVGSNTAASAYLQPGQTVDNSSAIANGNGIPQFNAQSSWQRGGAPAKLVWNGCGYAPAGWGQPGPTWLMVLDNLGLRRYIPTC